MEVIAAIAVVALFVIALFQIALALGAPWGVAAYGGSNVGRLPTRLRIASAVAGLAVYPLIAWTVWKAGAGEVAGLWMWLLTGLFTLGAIMNFASRSKVERWTWGPIASLVAICCGLLAAGLG